MSDTLNGNDAVLAVLAKDFTEQRIPRLIALKDKVDAGAVLDGQEFAFLAKVLEDAGRAMPLAAGNPDWHKLAARVAHFFHLITEQALQNEEKRTS